MLFICISFSSPHIQDLHTSYPYQLMMPEALAIVCAIQHNQTGVFRLTPSGMQIIGSCNEQGKDSAERKKIIAGACQLIQTLPSSQIA